MKKFIIKLIAAIPAAICTLSFVVALILSFDFIILIVPTIGLLFASMICFDSIDRTVATLTGLFGVLTGREEED